MELSMIGSGKKYFVAVLVLLMMGCSTASNDGAASVSFTVISSGASLPSTYIDTKVFETYTDQLAYNDGVSLYALPLTDEVIDFTSNQVVLVTMGVQNSGGYAIAAESIRDVGDYLELNMLLSSPGTNCVNTQELTHPYQVLKVSSLKEVRLVERNVTENCG